jgi:hypothetical protein
MERKLLVDTADNNTSNLSIQRKTRPSEVLLENWTYWIARETVITWQSSKSVSLNVDDVLTVLNLEGDHGFNLLFDTLGDKKKLVQSQPYSLEQPSSIQVNLDVYFNEFIALDVESLNYDLQLESKAILNKFLKMEFEKASPEHLMQFTEELAKKLLCKRQELEEEKKWHCERQDSAWKAFYRLCELEKKTKNKKIWNAAFLALNSRLSIEKYNHISYVIAELIQLCQSHYSIANNSFLMLEKIKTSLENRSSFNIIVSLPVFSKLNVINYDEQKELLEVWNGGHRLNFWGNSSISWKKLEERLLSNLEPVVLSLLDEFQSSFLQHLTIEEPC